MKDVIIKTTKGSIRLSAIAFATSSLHEEHEDDPRDLVHMNPDKYPGRTTFLPRLDVELLSGRLIYFLGSEAEQIRNQLIECGFEIDPFPDTPE